MNMFYYKLYNNLKNKIIKVNKLEDLESYIKLVIKINIRLKERKWEK